MLDSPVNDTRPACISPKTCQSVKSKSWEIKELGTESGQLWSKNPSRRRFLDKIKKTWTKMSWWESKRFRAPKQDFRGRRGQENVPDNRNACHVWLEFI